MKKIILLIIAFISTGVALNVYAEDDLDKFEAELEAELEAEIESESKSELESESKGKIGLSVTGDVLINSVSLTFEKLDKYDSYKIYYSKISDNNISEKTIDFSDEENEKIVVDIEGLIKDTEYQFKAKAFDINGNPIGFTESDEIIVKTKKSHKVASDNVIYSPELNVDGKTINISYEPGVDVEEVKINISDDGRVFELVDTIDGDLTEYSINVDEEGEKFVKIVPLDEDGNLGVCMVGQTEVENNIFSANVKTEKQKEVVEKMGEPKTGTTTYIILIFAFLVASSYVLIKKRA